MNFNSIVDMLQSHYNQMWNELSLAVTKSEQLPQTPELKETVDRWQALLQKHWKVG